MELEDQEYFASLEMRKQLTEMDVKLTKLRESGVRAAIQGDAGSVAVNSYGVVLAVNLVQQNIKYLNERTLGTYIIDAVATAQKRAQRLRRELLANDTEDF